MNRFEHEKHLWQQLRVLLVERDDDGELHGDDHHEDACPICRAIKILDEELADGQPDICPGDNKHCKVEGDEPHFRCGTVQCGQKALHGF